MDMGGNESVTREDKHLFWGQGNKRQGTDEVQEYKKDEDGLRRFSCALGPSFGN